MTGHPELSTTDLGYLGGGAWGAVRTGLVLLHGRGLVLAARPGRLGRTGSLPAGAEPLEQALFGALYGGMTPREVADQRRVRRALADQRESLIGLGLLRPAWQRFLLPAVLVVVLPVVVARLVAVDLLGIGVGLLVVLTLVGMAGWFLPRRTLTGERLFRAARRRQPLSADAVGAKPGPAGGEPGLDPGLAVALYGGAALVAVLPQFARDAGLLDGGAWSRLLGDSALDGSAMPPGATTSHP